MKDRSFRTSLGSSFSCQAEGVLLRLGRLLRLRQALLGRAPRLRLRRQGGGGGGGVPGGSGALSLAQLPEGGGVLGWRCDCIIERLGFQFRHAEILARHVGRYNLKVNTHTHGHKQAIGIKIGELLAYK